MSEHLTSGTAVKFRVRRRFLFRDFRLVFFVECVRLLERAQRAPLVIYKRTYKSQMLILYIFNMNLTLIFKSFLGVIFSDKKQCF